MKFKSLYGSGICPSVTWLFGNHCFQHEHQILGEQKDFIHIKQKPTYCQPTSILEKQGQVYHIHQHFYLQMNVP